MRETSWYSHFAKSTARFVGRPKVFVIAFAVVVIWAISGPLFGFSDTWQLVINTGTTIVTFLMVFLIQSTQNRDTEAIQVKLDELIRAVGHARNELLDLEELEERDLDDLKQTFIDLAKKARQNRVASRTAVSEL